MGKSGFCYRVQFYSCRFITRLVYDVVMPPQYGNELGNV